MFHGRSRLRRARTLVVEEDFHDLVGVHNMRIIGAIARVVVDVVEARPEEDDVPAAESEREGGKGAAWRGMEGGHQNLFVSAKAGRAAGAARAFNAHQGAMSW